MSDCSPLRLAENGQSSSPSQSLGSHNSDTGAGNSNNNNNRARSQQSQARLPTHARGQLGHSANHQTTLHDTNNHQVASDSRRPQTHRTARPTTAGQAFDGTNDHESLGPSDLQDNNAPHLVRSQSETSSKSGQLRYGARNVIELFIPVSICMLIVVGTMKATDSYQYSSQSVIWYAQMMFTDQSVDTGTRVWQSFANALIMLTCIVVMTTVLILLYKFRFYATIHGWLILGSLVLLFMFALMYIAEIVKVYNLPIDEYTVAIFIGNFGAVGMICIHWKGPLLLQQAYLIMISALMALVLLRCLPDWTIWTVLAIVSVWDLVAVLCPRGPLRILVETAQERNESIFPALIYSSTMAWETITMADRQQVPQSRTSKKSNNSNRQRRTRKSDTTDPHPEQSSSRQTSSQAGRIRAVPNSPVKREQHPVEIHYDDGAQPPEVAIVQPSISSSSNSDVWQRAVVRAVPSENENNLVSGVRPPRQASTSLQDGDQNLTVTFEPHNQGTTQGSTGQHQQIILVEEERGVKLGLGDFIFFSVLVGKASSYGDWTITMSCYVSILVGLCLTLSLLAIFRKALPALPISIAFGLSAFFLSYVFVVPFAGRLAVDQVFI